MGLLSFSVMSFIISLFKTIWDGFARLISWLFGIPALVISAFVGLYTSITNLINQFSQGGDFSSEVVSSVSDSVSGYLSDVSALPEASLLQFISYILSFDVLFDSVLVIFGLVLSLASSLLVFFVVTIPAWLISIYALKFTAWAFTCFLPDNWIPAGFRSIATFAINPGRIVHTHFKDGSPFPDFMLP